MTAPKTRKPRRPAGARGRPAGSKGRPAARQPPTPEGPAADHSGPGCAQGAGLQVLGPVVTATCWLEPGDGGQPYRAAVSFSGRRTGMSGKPRQGDRFERVETIGPVVAGSGPVSVTAKVSGLTPGEWIVWARPTFGQDQGQQVRALPAPPAAEPLSLRRFLWPKGNPVPAGNTGTRVTTRAAGFATGPGLIAASWVPLVAIGVIVALAVQAVLAGRAHLSVGPVLAVSLAASVAGAAGARIWFVALNRGKVNGLPTQGLCIQGFIAGAGAVLIPAVVLAGLPLGTFLDVTAPGLFLGMAIGRQGCFLHGCCTGRVTGSRWGIWASDGRVAPAGRRPSSWSRWPAW